MATIHKNLSVIEGALPSASGMKFGIVVSEWNTQVTAALLDGAYDGAIRFVGVQAVVEAAIAL